LNATGDNKSDIKRVLVSYSSRDASDFYEFQAVRRIIAQPKPGKIVQRRRGRVDGGQEASGLLATRNHMQGEGDAYRK
jgi:hypothetical protein